MIYPLPSPIPANYSYNAVRIEDMRYDPEVPGYRANVFGISSGQPMPLIFQNRSGLQRITECVISDTEIAAVQLINPDITVLNAALTVAMQRLYSLVQS
jgi:hypothetical protein